MLDGTGGTAANPAPPPDPEAAATARAGLEQQIAVDRGKARFLGRLGDFEVVPSRADVNAGMPCPPAVTVVPGSGRLAASELNQSETWEQTQCADGMVIAAYGPQGNRSYFTGAAKVVVDAPLDRLQLTSVGGRPALLVLPVVEIGPHMIYVIQRPPSPSAPGILAATTGREGYLSAIGAAVELLAP
jgi:hypothetical protein